MTNAEIAARIENRHRDRRDRAKAQWLTDELIEQGGHLLSPVQLATLARRLLAVRDAAYTAVLEYGEANDGH